MTEGRPPRRLDELGRRIQEARQREDSGGAGGPPGGGRQSASGLGLGLRLAVEMASALAVGIGLGYVLDTLFGTHPLLMIVFMVLGVVAGFMNVYRAAHGMSEAVGFGKAIEDHRAEAEGSARDHQEGPPRAADTDDDE